MVPPCEEWWGYMGPEATQSFPLMCAFSRVGVNQLNNPFSPLSPTTTPPPPPPSRRCFWTRRQFLKSIELMEADSLASFEFRVCRHHLRFLNVVFYLARPQ